MARRQKSTVRQPGWQKVRTNLNIYNYSLKAAFSQRKQHKHKVKHHLRKALFGSFLLFLFSFSFASFCCINWFSASQTRNHQVFLALQTTNPNQFCSRLRSPSCNFLCGTQHTHNNIWDSVLLFPPFSYSWHLADAVFLLVFDPLNPFCKMCFVTKWPRVRNGFSSCFCKDWVVPL